MVSDFLNLKNLVRRDYSAYYLKLNPFPTSAIPDESPPFTADRDREKTHFKDMMSELINNEKSSVTVFVGLYGSGKSHLMRALKHAVNTQLFNLNGDGTFSIYVRSPGRNFLDFCSELIEDIKKEMLVHFAEKIISDYCKKYRDSIAKFIYDDKLKKEIDSIENDIPKLLESSMVTDLFKSMAVKEFNQLKNIDVLFALLYTAHPTLSTYAWSWFMGSKLSRDEKELIMVRASIDNPKTAYIVFEDLMRLFNSAGIKNIVLFVDELEKLTVLAANLRSIYQDELRHLIDDFPHNLALFFSITGYHWQELSKENTGLVRRLENNIFQLDFFTLAQVKELIAIYLTHARTDDFDNKTKKINECDAELYPFTDESIEEIYAETKGVCSNIIKICRKCIDHITDRKKGEIVTSDLVQKLYPET